MAGQPASNPAFDATAAALAAKDDPPPPDPKDLLGDAACAGCHRSETTRVHATFHSGTLLIADTTHLGKLAPPTGPVSESGYVVARQGKTLYFTQDGKIAHGQPLQYAVGAGKHGVTYVRVLGAQKLIAMRMSYFPALKKWYPTPGARLDIDHYVGDKTEGKSASLCLPCHAVKVDKSTGTVPDGFLGVGCESCHGAGRAHVEAMKSGNMTDIHMERLNTWSARRLNRMCGVCHGNGDGFRPNDAGITSMTNRFMSYGLMRSRCFVEGVDGEGGADRTERISCITCHDSHTNATTSNAYYEARCLNCHSANTNGSAAPISTTENGKESISGSDRTPIQRSERTPAGGRGLHVNTVCKVNPRTGCIGCHMPRRELLPGLRLPVEMADHYIRIHRETGTVGGTH